MNEHRLYWRSSLGKERFLFSFSLFHWEENTKEQREVYAIIARQLRAAAFSLFRAPAKQDWIPHERALRVCPAKYKTLPFFCASQRIMLSVVQGEGVHDKRVVQLTTPGGIAEYIFGIYAKNGKIGRYTASDLRQEGVMAENDFGLNPRIYDDMTPAAVLDKSDEAHAIRMRQKFSAKERDKMAVREAKIREAAATAPHAAPTATKERKCYLTRDNAGMMAIF